MLHDHSWKGLRNNGEKMRIESNNRLCNSCFEIGEIIDRISEQTNIEHSILKDMIYVQWFMVRSVMMSGSFDTCDIPGIGTVTLKSTYRNRGKKQDELGVSIWKDPFLRMTSKMILRYIKRGLSINELHHKKKAVTIFNELDELGQRYYVLDGKSAGQTAVPRDIRQRHFQG